MKQTEKSLLASNQGGFTLIELIMVIVILGLLSVVAIPKYVDMRTQAAVAAADGVYAAAQSAAAINFAAGLAGVTPPANGIISNGAGLMLAMDGTPEGWEINEATIHKRVGSKDYIITVDKAETAEKKAVLTKNW